jgi:hypothetical protein
MVEELDTKLEIMENLAYESRLNYTIVHPVTFLSPLICLCSRALPPVERLCGQPMMEVISPLRAMGTSLRRWQEPMCRRYPSPPLRVGV